MRNLESFFFLKKIQRLAHSENFIFTKLVIYKPLRFRKNQKTLFFDNSKFLDLHGVGSAQYVYDHACSHRRPFFFNGAIQLAVIRCSHASLLALYEKLDQIAPLPLPKGEGTQPKGQGTQPFPFGLRSAGEGGELSDGEREHFPSRHGLHKKINKTNLKSYQSQQLHVPVNKFFLIFVSIFQKLIKKQILYFHEIVPSFFIENLDNMFVFFKPLQNVQFFHFFSTFFSKIKTNSFFYKKQQTNLQIAFLKKQKKTEKFFFNIFFNINRNKLKNFPGIKKNFFLVEQKEQQKQSFCHFLLFLLFLSNQKQRLTCLPAHDAKCTHAYSEVKAIKKFSFCLKDFLQFEKSNYSNFFFQFFKEIQIFLFFILKHFKDFQIKHTSLFPKNTWPPKTPLHQGICKFSNKHFEYFQTKMFCLNLIKTKIFQTTKNNFTKKAVFSKKKFTKKIYNLLFFSILNHKFFSYCLQIPNCCFLKQFTEQKKIYQKIQSINILEFAKKNFQILFEYFETQNFLNLGLFSSQNLANFQMIFHQSLKIPLYTVSAKIKNEHNFLNHHLLFLSKEIFLFSKKNFVCLSFINNIHLLPTLSNKTIFTLASVCKQHIAANKKRFHSFFQSNLLTQNMFFDIFDKTNKNLYLKLSFLYFEKNLFHFFTLSKIKDFNRKKENLSSGKNQSFSFSKQLYENLLGSLFLIFESNYSNYLFFNSTVFLFLKKFYPLLTYKKVFSWYLQRKNLLSTLGTFLKNFVFFKNLSVSKLYLTKNFHFFHYAKTKKSPFCLGWIQNKPFVSGFESFSSFVFKNQKQMQNLFIFQNVYWQFSKKFFFLQTKISKITLFHFFPLFSCFLGLNNKNLSFFLAPEKSFLDSPQVLLLNDINTKGQDVKKKLLRKKAIVLLKDQVFLYEQKNFQHFIFENKKFRALNFDGFSVSLIVYYQKQLKNYYIFEKIPTREKINFHLTECKQILKKSIGKKQIFFMKKLHQKIIIWCKKYKDISKKEVFDYCDSMLLKFLWNWARKTHPNKSKNWIRKKYFHLIHSNNWFFGKKIGKNFVCLPLHSQKTKS